MKTCKGCDHTPSDCLSCEAQIYTAWDPDITILDEWARVARTRDMRERSDALIICADFLSGLNYCRTPEAMKGIAETLAGLRDDARVRALRERFRVERLAVLAALTELKHNT